MIKIDKITCRRKAIKNLINSHEIEDQNMLVQMLKEKHGITTTQSITSRDLRQLGIAKRKCKNKMIYETPKINMQKELLRQAILDIVFNESIIIIKTIPGIADFIGDFIDLQENLETIGTLSGENTIFVIPRSIKTIEITYKKLCLALYFNK